MTPRARRTWRTIIASLTPSHFRPGDHPLLRSYCESEALHWEATKSIKAEGAVVRICKVFDEGTDKQREVVIATKANPWVAIQTQTAHTMAQLATKLRLCANSRLSNAKAGFEKPAQSAKSSRAGLKYGGRE
jgi:phage terminase small subunit